MAFKIRCEFWKLSTTGDGIASVILDEVVADALEYEANTGTPVDLPDHVYNYAMSVWGITGAATVEVAANPTEQVAQGRLVMEGANQWFIIKPESRLFVQEYTLA